MSPQNLVQEIGRRLGITLELDQAGLARIVIDDELPVDFELDQGADRLLAYATIGCLPAGSTREIMFAELLSANLFGVGLGSCSPALDQVRDELLLWCAFDTGTEIEPAIAAIEQLVAHSMGWRTRLARGVETPIAQQTAFHGSADPFLMA